MKKRKTKTLSPKKNGSQLKTSPELIEKQKIKDLEHHINMELGTFLVLIDEGTMEQVSLAKQKAKSSLLKYGPDMYKIALGLDAKTTSMVEDFLNSVDHIVHSAGWLDEALVKTYYNATQQLDRSLASV